MRKASFVSLVALGLMGLLSSGAAVAQEPAGRDGKQAAMLGLMVPADAQVWIEGARMKETGTMRWFRSPPLEPGKDFIWTIRLQWTEDGKPVEKTRQVHVRAGDRLSMDFAGATGGQAVGAAPYGGGQRFYYYPPTSSSAVVREAPPAMPGPSYGSSDFYFWPPTSSSKIVGSTPWFQR